MRVIGNMLKGKVLYVQGNFVLYYHNAKFYILDIITKRCEAICKAPMSRFKRLISRLRLLCRLMRLEPRACQKIKDGMFLCCFGRKIWEIDVSNHKISKLIDNRDGWSDPLNFCIDDKGNIYWGEYGNNPNYEEVNIYQRTTDGDVRIAYTFPASTVRHIHNIIYDKRTDHFYILTGDNEPTAGIYEASSDWGTVKPILVGKQKYRSVVGFPYQNGLIYATDSVNRDNYIFYLDISTKELKCLQPINGSCIYGVENAGCFYFSTTVEPPEGRGLAQMFSYKLGEGIKSRESHLVCCDKKSGKTNVISIFKKDWLPMKLFQYGSIQFPLGQQDREDLCFYVMACKKKDGRSFWK